MTDSSPRQGTTPHAAAPGSASPQPQPAPSGGDVLSVLAEFEEGLDSLKQLYVQRQALAEELKRRSDQMAAAEAELRARKEDFAARERELSKASAALGERWQVLESREQSISAERKSIQDSLAALTSRETLAAQREQAAAEALRKSEQQIAQLEALEADLTRRAAEQSQRQEAIARRSADLDSKSLTIDQALGQIKADREALQSSRAELERKTSELATSRRSLETLQSELDLRRADLERDRAQLTSLAQQVERSNIDATSAITTAQKLQAATDELKSRLAEADRKLLSQADVMERLRQEHEGIVSGLREQAKVLQSRLDEATEGLAQADRKLQAQTDAMQRLRQEHDGVVTGLRDQATQLQAHLDAARNGQQGSSAQSARAKQELDQALREREQAQRELEQAKAQIHAANEALANAQHSADLRAAQLAGQLESALACCAEVFDEYESLWKHEVAEHLRTRRLLADREEQLAAVPPPSEHPQATSTSTTDEQAEALADRLRKACEALVQLRDERAELVAKAQSLQGELDRARRLISQSRASSPTGKAAHPAAIQRRRERLELCRTLSRKRAQKIKKAEDALATRFEQCERILGMRQELAEARELITAAQRRTDRQRASGKTAALAFYGSAAAALLGVLSWFGTQQAIPAIFSARAIIAADARGRTLGPGEFAEWQTFHEGLVTDPRFFENAAERMERRGITELGKPGDLAKAAHDHLVAQSGTAGELLLEWRGEGSERTQRILDTLVTALASQANAARERRVDGAVTQIRQPSTAGTERLDTDYRWIAACVWGGSMILTFGLAALFWRRLSNAKATFEGSATVDAALDTRRWNLPMRK